MITITQDYIKTGTKRRPGLKLKGAVVFLVAHDTGNPETTAKGNVSYFKNSANEMEASAHFFVDDIDIIACIPDDEKAWHVWYSVGTDNAKYGVDANDYALGIELCYFKDVARMKKAYQNYVDLFAFLCNKFKLDPLKFISGHFELDPARKTDPNNAFKIIGKTMDSFKKDVVAAMGPVKPPLTTAKIGDNGANISAIQSILRRKGYILKPFTEGLYDDSVAQAVLYMQMDHVVAKMPELASLRGEVVGPKTLEVLKELQNSN